MANWLEDWLSGKDVTSAPFTLAPGYAAAPSLVGGKIQMAAQPIIDTVNAINANNLGLGWGNGEPKKAASSWQSFNWNGAKAPSGSTAKAGADTGGGWAIDWFGNGSVVTGNPGLVDKDPVDVTINGGNSEASIWGGLIEGVESTFARIAIIILGFIFVAAGLAMFKNTAPVIVKTVGAAL